MPPDSSSTARIVRDSRRQQAVATQVGLLYANRNVSLCVTVLAATLLSRLEWGAAPHSTVLAWWIVVIAVAAARYALALSFRRRAAPDGADIARWRMLFAAGAGLAGAGWGAAGILLYPQSDLVNQVFLVFVLGGMMLGAASLLAPRPEAFLAFLIPTGLAPAVRLVMQGDRTHVAMGFLAAAFTVAVTITTALMHCTIGSSIRLQFANRDLVDDLQTAKKETEALNQALELRVEERTAELRAEIEQRQKMEEELLRARKLESLGVLAGGIAHDFNNFLTVVQGNIEVVKSGLHPENSLQTTLDQAATACQRAAFLSSQLLTFAKGGAPVRRLVAVERLVTEAAQLARTGAQVSISISIAEGLPYVWADPAQIGQVLHSILLNARQAMPDCGIIEVHAGNLAGRGPEPWVRIAIRDYGCGIPAENLSRIFDPYFTSKPGSSGLGLATAYAIVNKHGGHISVESKAGEGTTVFLDLPATTETPAPQPSRSLPPRAGSERLLVMDDEAAIRNLLTAVLSKFGYEVRAARDGAEAIALYEKAQAAGKGFDAVLLDVTVPGGMGGIEAAAKLKEMDPGARLIVSSGYSEAPVMSDFTSYGFDAVLPKPWTADKVGEVFRRVLVADTDRKLD